MDALLGFFFRPVSSVKRFSTIWKLVTVSNLTLPARYSTTKVQAHILLDTIFYGNPNILPFRQFTPPPLPPLKKAKNCAEDRSCEIPLCHTHCTVYTCIYITQVEKRWKWRVLRGARGWKWERREQQKKYIRRRSVYALTFGFRPFVKPYPEFCSFFSASNLIFESEKERNCGRLRLVFSSYFSYFCFHFFAIRQFFTIFSTNFSCWFVSRCFCLLFGDYRWLLKCCYHQFLCIA